MQISHVIVGIAMVGGVGSLVGVILNDPQAGEEGQARAARLAATHLMPGMSRAEAELKLRSHGFERVESREYVDHYQYRASYLDVLNVQRKPVYLLIRTDRNGGIVNYSVRR